MKKLHPLLSVLFLIYWGCDDPKEENKPTPVTLSITDNTIKWTMNKDTDFFRYSLYGLNDSSMENRTLIYETQTRLDTTYTLDSNEYYSSYQVDVMNLNESVSSSNILTGFVELWGTFCLIEDTTKLDLSDRGLTGSIPPEIGNLTNLTCLYLNDNQLTGEIPESICDLNISWSDSELFRIYNNQLCPPYPSCIEDFMGEQDYCNCDGIVELWGKCYIIEYTTELDLRGRGLTGSIPSEIGNLTNLTYLDLGNNQLTGEIPTEISNLTNLEYLNLIGNELTGSIPPEIGNLTNLIGLDLSFNQLTGSIPPEIGNLINLNYLVLNDNQLTGEIPSEIGNLTNQTHLSLGSNELTGEIPTDIWNLTNLTHLFLNDNQLTGSIPPEIGNLTNLEILRLSNNQLSGEIPESICDLNIWWSLSDWDERFSIYYNQLCPPYPSCIEDYVGEQDTSNCGD